MSMLCDDSVPEPGWREVTLREGEQIVVNGALVTAAGLCRFSVGSGASILRGKESSPGAGHPLPAHELYYAVLEAGNLEDSLAENRYRLFDLLGQVVALQRTHAAQQDCPCLAAALLGSDVEGVLAAARKLAAREAGKSTPDKRQGSEAAQAVSDPCPRSRSRRGTLEMS